ncbi:MAG TPA: EamA family transporter [Streptosporangiaceae bacterium]|nr:EamA family transporter [Streptosporangiaceae bacterium]
MADISTGRDLAVRGPAGRQGQLLAWAALIAVYLVWGSTYLAIRVGVRDIPPGMLAGVRYLVAGAILYPVAARTGGAELRGSDRPGRREWLGSALVGLLLLVIGNGGVTLAEKSLPSGLAAVLVATVPLWMVVFAVPVQRQRVTLRAAAGLVAGLAGVAVLVGGGSAGGHAGAIVVVLAAAASWGLGSVISRRLRLPRRALLAAAMEMLAAGVVLLIVAAVTGEAGQAHWGSVSAGSWAALAWLVIPGSILAFTAYGYALAHLPLATVSTYAYVNPVVAVVLGVIVLSERLTLREALGALLVVVSVAITLYRPARPASPARTDQAGDDPVAASVERRSAVLVLREDEHDGAPPPESAPGQCPAAHRQRVSRRRRAPAGR